MHWKVYILSISTYRNSILLPNDDIFAKVSSAPDIIFYQKIFSFHGFFSFKNYFCLVFQPKMHNFWVVLRPKNIYFVVPHDQKLKIMGCITTKNLLILGCITTIRGIYKSRRDRRRFYKPGINLLWLSWKQIAASLLEKEKQK